MSCTGPESRVSPADIDLIREGAEERRKLIDMVISQSDPRYLDALIRYGRALEQRNQSSSRVMSMASVTPVKLLQKLRVCIASSKLLLPMPLLPSSPLILDENSRRARLIFLKLSIESDGHSSRV